MDYLYHILALLIKTRSYAIDNEDFYNKTDITVLDIDKCSAYISEIIASSMASKMISNEKCKNYNKTHREYNNATSNMCDAKRRGNMERYNYWKRKRDELKKKGGE